MASVPVGDHPQRVGMGVKDTNFELNGEEPPIRGHACEGLVAIEYWYEGDLVEPANVVFLRFGGRWYRLYFDFTTVFWRSEAEGPEGFAVVEADSEFRPVDLGQRWGLLGAVLADVIYVPRVDGVAVHLEFADQRVVQFECVDDVTGYSKSDGWGPAAL